MANWHVWPNQTKAGKIYPFFIHQCGVGVYRCVHHSDLQCTAHLCHLHDDMSHCTQDWTKISCNNKHGSLLELSTDPGSVESRGIMREGGEVRMPVLAVLFFLNHQYIPICVIGTDHAGYSIRQYLASSLVAERPFCTLFWVNTDDNHSQ